MDFVENYITETISAVLTVFFLQAIDATHGQEVVVQRIWAVVQFGHGDIARYYAGVQPLLGVTCIAVALPAAEGEMSHSDKSRNIIMIIF